MKIVIAGLGRMGGQIARKLSEDGHDVIAHNRSREPVEEASKYGAKASFTKEEAASLLGKDKPIVWLMVPADVVESELKAWLSILPKGCLIIDGGNSDYRNTQKHAELVSSHDCSLVDVGTSGGVWGYKNGFSMMVGGNRPDFGEIEPILKTLAKPGGGYAFFEGSGAGHFVKMVHNAIEYGMMESLAEGYHVLKEGPYKNLDLAAAGQVWQEGSVINSWLNELCRQALSENPNLDDIGGVVAESGEARWTLETAKGMNISLPSIDAAFDVRLKSQKGEVNFATKLLAAMRNKFGGHVLNPASPEESPSRRIHSATRRDEEPRRGSS